MRTPHLLPVQTNNKNKHVRGESHDAFLFSFKFSDLRGVFANVRHRGLAATAVAIGFVVPVATRVTASSISTSCYKAIRQAALSKAISCRLFSSLTYSKSDPHRTPPPGMKKKKKKYNRAYIVSTHAQNNMFVSVSVMQC